MPVHLAGGHEGLPLAVSAAPCYTPPPIKATSCLPSLLPLGWWQCKADSSLCGSRLATSPSHTLSTPWSCVPLSLGYCPLQTDISSREPQACFQHPVWSQPVFFFFPLWRVTHGCWNHHYQHLTPPTWGRLTHPRLAPGQLGLCSAQGVPMVHRSGLGRDRKLFSFLFSF